MTMKTVHECHATGCMRKVSKVGHLVCDGHWKLLPRDLRRLLHNEQNARWSKQKQDRVVAAAGLCIAYLEDVKIQLPPEGA